MHKPQNPEVITRVFPDRIAQSIAIPGREERLAEYVVELRAQGVQEGLKQLGYLAPEEAKVLRDERDALAAHLERIKACRLESGRIGIWSLNIALKDTPATSLVLRDAQNREDGMRKALEMITTEIEFERLQRETSLCQDAKT